jgi:multiple sugar transport system permease protein
MTRILGRAIAYLVLIALGIIGIAPFLYLAILSAKRRIEILAQVPPDLHFEWATIARTYQEVMYSQGMLSFTVNSAIVVGLATALAVIIGTPAAYAFSRMKFRGNENLASAILSMRFMPPLAVAIPLFLMIKSIGLQNTYLGLILPYTAFSLPLVVWIMIGFFDEIPREIDDAAFVDGCSHLVVLWRVMVPLVRPGIVTAALFGATCCRAWTASRRNPECSPTAFRKALFSTSPAPRRSTLRAILYA